MKLRRETDTSVFCDRAVIVPLSTTYKVLLPKQREANCCTSAIDLVDCQSTSSAWCLEVDSNHRHNGYEPFFLPTELPRHELTSLFFYIPWLKFASSTAWSGRRDSNTHNFLNPNQEPYQIWPLPDLFIFLLSRLVFFA